jgi:hypothetical protein
MLTQTAEHHGDRTAFAYGSEVTNYREVNALRC